MSYKRILTIQDISCVGQCSLTVALPVLSASGNEACILPSAVLSTHTGGFKGYTFHDLTDDFPAVAKHWISEKIDFDAFYTGYLGSLRQIDLVNDIVNSPLAKKDSLFVVDPVLGDNGVLYKGFNAEIVAAMRRLIKRADIIIPNITEACQLTDTEYRTDFDKEYIRGIVGKLQQIMGRGKTIVMTGVGFNPNETGVGVFSDGEEFYYPHIKLDKNVSGTGDIFASAFIGALLNGHDTKKSATIAADFTLLSIKETVKNPAHWYGVKFETVLGEYIRMLGR
ncbi:MAG: pyridoxamine kinase [Bacteroidales bacterium]|nr:pyridoxamine kinase [Bacteroidales bacterium]